MPEESGRLPELSKEAKNAGPASRNPPSIVTLQVAGTAATGLGLGVLHRDRGNDGDGASCWARACSYG